MLSRLPRVGDGNRRDGANVSVEYRHARDIPDDVFLAAVTRAADIRLFERGKHDESTMRWYREYPEHKSATCWDVATVLSGQGELVGTDQSTHDWPGVPPKVVLAKAQRLINRGMLTGCTCGCRGDFGVRG